MTEPNQSNTPTPRTDADIACECLDKLASECRLNPTAYQREGKERVRTLERELTSAKQEIERLTKLLQSECDHEWEYHDDSFDHEFGTERIPPYEVCLKCDLNRPYEAPEID